ELLTKSMYKSIRKFMAIVLAMALIIPGLCGLMVTRVEAKGSSTEEINFSFEGAGYSATDSAINIGGTKYYQVSQMVSGQNYMFGCKRDDGSNVVDILKALGGGRNYNIFTYSASGSGGSGSTSKSSFTVDGYTLTFTENGISLSGSSKKTSSESDEETEDTDESENASSSAVLTDTEATDPVIFLWFYENEHLSYLNGETYYYLTFKDNKYSCTANEEEAVNVSLYTCGDVKNHAITKQPEAVKYVTAGSGYETPTFTAYLNSEVEITTLKWYVDGEAADSLDVIISEIKSRDGVKDGGEDTVKVDFTASSLKEKSAGLYRVYMHVEGRDSMGNYYAEDSNVVNFVVANGVVSNSVMSFADIHEEYEKIGLAIEDFMNKNDGKIPALIMCTGDFVNGATSSTRRMEDLIYPIINAELGGIDTVYVSGNHETAECSVLESKRANLGATDELDSGAGVIFDSASEAVSTNGLNSKNTDGLTVFAINYFALEKKDSEGNITYNYDMILPQLEKFLEEKKENYKGEPIFISAHAGLHVLGMQSESKNTKGEQLSDFAGNNEYNVTKSDEVVTLLNKYATDYKMDIIYLFGHNHSKSEVEFFLKAGDSITSTVDYSAKSVKTQTINFSYGHAGYLSSSIGSANDHYIVFTWDENTIKKQLIHLNDSSAEGCIEEDINSLIYTDRDNKISISKTVYNKTQGKQQKITLKPTATGGNISYSTDVSNVTVSTKGVVTIKKNYTGKITITIKASGHAFKTATKKVVINVAPKKVTLTAKRTGSTKIKVSWKKIKNVTGYEVSYSTNKKFKKKKTTTTFTKKKKLVIKGLKAGKKYFVRVRAYKKYKEDGKAKKLYSKYSKVKKA
ncbi:MAG: metallophosphoesterase, partial [Lachnospiraceae bacterium]|nr:metallophosphoesterase [Lachnospiraceae bacterium]